MQLVLQRQARPFETLYVLVSKDPSAHQTRFFYAGEKQLPAKPPDYLSKVLVRSLNRFARFRKRRSQAGSQKRSDADGALDEQRQWGGGPMLRYRQAQTYESSSGRRDDFC